MAQINLLIPTECKVVFNAMGGQTFHLSLSDADSGFSGSLNFYDVDKKNKQTAIVLLHCL